MSLNKFEGLLKKYAPLMSRSIERVMDRSIKYGAVFTEVDAHHLAYHVCWVNYGIITLTYASNSSPFGLPENILYYL